MIRSLMLYSIFFINKIYKYFMDNLFSTNHEMIPKTEKEKLLKQKGICLWLTGLSGSGKTSIAKAVAKKLHSKGFITKVLDGDNIRLGINKNLSFSELDRMENIRRTAEISKLFVDCGIVTICCLVSPKKNMRTLAKEIIGESSACLEFENTIDGIHLNGIDLITWNEKNLITEFRVLVRPLQAVNMLHKMMGKMLETMSK